MDIQLPDWQAEALSDAADREADVLRHLSPGQPPSARVHYLHGVRDAFLLLRGVLNPHSDLAPEALRAAYRRYLDSI